MSKSKSGKSQLLPQDPQATTFQPWPADPGIQHSPSSGSSTHHSGSTGSSTDLSSGLTTAALTTSLTTSLSITPQVVQIIDTTKWSAPSPDPSGMAYVPGTGLLMVDSEIDETPFFRTDNLFHLSATGAFNSSSSLEGFTVEPTGIVYASPLGHLFISDDDKNRVFELDASNPA